MKQEDFIPGYAIRETRVWPELKSTETKGRRGFQSWDRMASRPTMFAKVALSVK